MSKKQDLLQERGEIYKGIQSLSDHIESGKEWTAETKAKFEELTEKYHSKTNEIKAYEEALRIGDSLNAENLIEQEKEKKNITKDKPAPTEGEVFIKYYRAKANDLAPEFSAEERKVFNQMTSRALSTTDSEGGVSIPEEWAPSIYAQMLDFGPFAVQRTDSIGDNRRPGLVVETPGGGTMHFPRTNDTANTGRILSEGSSAASGATDPAYTEMTLDAFTYTSDLIQVSNQLLQDTGVDFPAHLAMLLSERLGRIYNEDLTNGEGGASSPLGITQAATLFDATANTGVITQDEIRNLKFSVDAAYHNRPQSGFMLHQNTLSAIMALDLSTTNYTQPLFQPSFAAGAPPTILGSTYWINNNLATLDDAGGDLMLFGDFSKFYIRRAGGIVLRQLNERYAELNQTAWVGFMRFDSDLIDTSAVKRLKEDAT